MLGKGFVRVIAIALFLGCLYSISFNWVAGNVEKKAKENSKGNSVKERNYLDSVANLPAYPVFNFTYTEVKEKCLNLGLDLKGGMNVTMAIELGELVRSLSDFSPDHDFNRAIELANSREKTSQTDYITLFTNAYKEVSPSGNLALIFSTKENSSKINPTSTEKTVHDFLETEANSAFDRSFNILRTRIDKFGVTQPNIQKIAGTNHILIELPGINEPERVRKLLQGSAKLEFWETYDNQQVYGILQNINKVLAAKNKLNDSTKNPKSVEKSLVSAKIDSAKQKSGPSLLSKIKKDSAGNTRQDTSSRSGLMKQNPLFAVLSPAVYSQGGQQALAKGAMVGLSLKKDTSVVNAYLAQPEVRSIIPSTMKFLWSVKSNAQHLFELYAIKVANRDGKAALEGDVISDARADFDARNNPEVVMIMNTEGANTWKTITAKAAQDENNKQSIAIVLDNQVYSAPTVQNEISGGVSSISGSFSIEETKDLANVLKAGRLPAPARIVEESIVGPTLGQEAINSGLVSSMVALLAVLVFMAFYYDRAGWVADITVVLNVFFIIGVLASLQSVLTLPGIAGIVLTIATSVDANVLIYERVREELADGKSLRMAIADGFKHAYSSIIDSNVATMLLGAILLWLGTGPIKGFAITLLIGIFTSFFSAVFITRLILDNWLNRDRKITFDNSITRNAFKNTHFDFLSRRVLFYSVSGVIIAIGIVSMFTRGFTLGVDFKGGRTYDIEFANPVSAGKVRDVLTKPLGAAPEVQTITGTNRVKVTTSLLVDSSSTSAESTVNEKLRSGLASITGNTYKELGHRKVGPTIASDIKNRAVWAILLGITVVFFYILIRFRRWQFGIAAVVALAHDVLILLSLFSIFNGLLPFSLEIDQAFIGSVLTVMGYSMLDTVVVFDRVREFMGKSYREDQGMASVINNALNSTLSRTVITGLTTLAVLLILFIFGGESLKGFSFAMLIGVIFGTYSSIFVATPIVVDLIRKDSLKDLEPVVLAKDNKLGSKSKVLAK